MKKKTKRDSTPTATELIIKLCDRVSELEHENAELKRQLNITQMALNISVKRDYE
jgi:hypothetical protein